MYHRKKESQHDPKDALASLRAQARYLALALSRLGHDPETIEKQLCASGFHPSICYETANWIQSEMSDEGQLKEPENCLRKSSWN